MYVNRLRIEIDFWQMNFCSNICKKYFVISNVQLHQKEDLSWGHYPISICCLAKILFVFHPILPFLEYFRKSLSAFFLFKIGFMVVPNMPSLSDRSLPCLASLLVSALVKTYLKWPWPVKIHKIFSKVTQPLLALPAVVSFDSHVVDVGTKQKPRNWRRNKSHVVVVVFIGRRKQKPCCWCRNKQKPRCSCWRKTKAMLLMSEQNKC